MKGWCMGWRIQDIEGRKIKGYGNVLATSVASTSLLMTWLAAAHGAFGVKWALMLEALCVSMSDG
jgi:hypothetical protein